MSSYVYVHCDNPRAHASRYVRLELFERGADGDWYSWPQSVKRRAGQPFGGERNAMSLLDGGDRVLDEQEIFDNEGNDLRERIARRRFAIECPLCGLNVSVRAERLEPILDQLEGHDEPTSIPLRWLAAKLAST